MMTFSSKILHVSTQKQLRGGERQILLLHKGLIEQGMQSYICCRKGGALHKLSNVINTVGVSTAGQWNLRGIISILQLCSKLKFSLIHCHDSHALSIAVYASLLRHIPLVSTRRVVFRIQNHIFNRWKYSRCSAVVAISSAVASKIKQIAPANKIQIIHDGVELDNNSDLDRQRAREKLGLAKDAFVIGTVGYFTGEKNFSLVLRCAQSLATAVPQAVVVCVGPVNRTQAEAAAKAANLMCVGYIEKVSTLYKAFDIYISTSKSEGLGSALIDAVVRDIPAVAIDGGGTSDIFSSQYPYLIASDKETLFIDALIHAVCNYSQARAISRTQCERARKIFSAEAMIENHVKLYNKLLAKCEVRQASNNFNFF